MRVIIILSGSIHCNMHSSSDLALQALGFCPGDRELDSLGVPAVLRVLSREVDGHTVNVSALCEQMQA